MKEVMKKILNIIGYLTILSVPVLLLVFYLVLHTPIKIVCCIALIIVGIIHIIHIKKTKIKYIGIRILITIVSLICLTYIVHNVYGIIKTANARELLKSIEKIEFMNYQLNEEDLADADIQFVNENHIISKAYWDSKIYYKDGSIENSKVNFNGVYVYKINGENYYISNLPIY